MRFRIGIEEHEKDEHRQSVYGLEINFFFEKASRDHSPRGNIFQGISGMGKSNAVPDSGGYQGLSLEQIIQQRLPVYCFGKDDQITCSLQDLMYIVAWYGKKDASPLY